jgi:hypothetical protein
MEFCTFVAVYQTVTMKNKNSQVSCRSNELAKILKENFGDSINLARIKFISLFICALCKVRTVCFEKCACAFDNQCDTASSLRRIQRFMADYMLDTDLIAKTIFKLLPHKPPFKLAMDRTNWKFGQTNINVLTLAITYKGLAFPILFSMLPKCGNSNTTERIALIDRFIPLFGKNSIDCLLADREFVGYRWIKYLNDKSIRYYVRIRENFYVVNPRSGKRLKASWMFANLQMNKSIFFYKIYYVNGELCYLSASKVKNKAGVPELQIIISYNKPEKAIDTYKERWQIETAFRALKSSGFNIEDTHLTDIKRIEKLFSLVMIAFAWCYVVGVFLHQNDYPIRLSKNGNLLKSFFRHGLDTIAKYLLNPEYQYNVSIFKFLSYT